MLIIYAHFSRTGHNGVILKEVENWLKQRGQAYEVLDLYGIGFDPVLGVRDISQADGTSSDVFVHSIQEKILKAKNLIFIYPTWWSNVPAILKGFYDRVLMAQFAFRYGSSGLPEGLLKGRRALVFTTSGGPAVYQKIFRGSRSIKVTTDDTLEFCGLRTQSVLIGNCRALDEKKKIEITKKVIIAMKKFVSV